jgi:hypothetical protein
VDGINDALNKHMSDLTKNRSVLFIKVMVGQQLFRINLHKCTAAIVCLSSVSIPTKTISRLAAIMHQYVIIRLYGSKITIEKYTYSPENPTLKHF